jgi:hypothetical protein
VATASTPSRDSHEVRHCEKARQARSGRPRCSTDDPSPVLLEDGAFCFKEADNAVVVVSVGEGKGTYAVQIWSD